MKDKEGLDLIISFDTTGSMSSCIAQVRQQVKEVTSYLSENIPNLRIGIISHGDWCDGKNCLNILEFTSDYNKVANFIKTTPNTSGGDADECYELVLHTVRSMDWVSKKNKALILIGDASPHNSTYRIFGATPYDWKNEAQLLVDSGVKIYPVKALNDHYSTSFYDGLAKISGTERLDLHQFSDVVQTLLAIAMHQDGQLDRFISKSLHKISYAVQDTVDKLAGKKVKSRKTKNSLHAVDPARFQIFTLSEDSDIKSFVESQGFSFAKGKGFYEFTKPVVIQDYKEVIIVDEENGDMFNGNKARELLGIPVGETAKVKPVPGKYSGFVQSTSSNRKLLAGTRFLYEI